MRASVIWGAALLATLVSPLARAEEQILTGVEFMGICRTAIRIIDNPNLPVEAEDAADAGRCIGVIEGVGGLYVVFAAAKMIPDKLQVCLPQSATNEQLVRVTVKFMEQYPEQLGVNAGAVTFMALRHYFPCSH